MKKNKEYLESKLKKLSTDYIFQQAVSSFLLLLMSSTEQELPSDFSLAYELPQEIKKIQKEVTKTVLNLETLLDGKKEPIKELLDVCLNLKKELVQMYDAVYQYYSLWNIASSPLNDEVAIRKYQEEGVASKKIEFNLFQQDCITFLNSTENPLQQKSLISQLLKCIPMRMARSKYFDFLRDCLELAFEKASEQTIAFSLHTFQKTIAPESQNHYGVHFPEIAEWLSEKKNLKPSSLSDEELAEEYSDFQSIFESLTKIEYIFSNTFQDLNSLIVLFYLGFSFEDLTQRNFVYSDLYHSVCELLSNELEDAERGAFAERVYQLLEEAVEPVIDEANRLSEEEDCLADKLDLHNLSEDTMKTLISETFVREQYYADLNDEIFDFEEDPSLPPASQEWKEKKYDQFISFLQEYFGLLPSQFRKSAMQLLSTSLPSACTAKEALERIHSAFDEAPSFEHKVLIVDKAGMIFSDNGFSYETEEEEEHHHHDEHCGCGCHHHHDHIF